MSLLEAQPVPHRMPAIAQNKLRLRNGAQANKQTLQEVALAAGFPVPHFVVIQDIPQTHTYSDDPFAYQRGYFEGPLDMWAVDVLPTTAIYDQAGLAYYQQRQQTAFSNEAMRQFLATNFDEPQLQAPKSFLQKEVKANVFVSTLGRGPHLFCSANQVNSNRGNSWVHYEDGQVAGYSHYGAERLTDAIVPMVEQINAELDNALNGSYEYKHDFLTMGSGRSIHLIQSRVASPKMTAESIAQEALRVKELLSRGTQHIMVEVSDIGKINGPLRDAPTVLTLTNDRHQGIAQMEEIHALDMNNVVGLQLPQGLEGGLLRHNAYAIIAYALYWGIPIRFI